MKRCVCLTVLFVLLLSTVNVSASTIQNGLILDNPWIDSGFQSTVQGVDVKYSDTLIPYDTTMEAIGGNSIYQFRSTDKYGRDIFYDIPNKDKKYFGQSGVGEFGYGALISYIANLAGISSKPTYDQMVSGTVVNLKYTCGGTKKDCKFRYDAESELMVLDIDGVKFYIVAAPVANNVLSKHIAPNKADIVEATSGFRGGCFMDVFLADGTVIHCWVVDCFGETHSTGAGTVSDHGDPLCDNPKSISELKALNGSLLSQFQSDGLGFYHAINSSGGAGDPCDENLKLWWSSTVLLKQSTQSEFLGIHDGIVMGQTELRYLQYAYMMHANGNYPLEPSGGKDSSQGWTNFYKNVLKWDNGFLGTDCSDEMKKRRIIAFRWYNIHPFKDDCIQFKFTCDSGTVVDCNYTGPNGVQASLSLTPGQAAAQADYKRAIAEEWTVLNALFESDLRELFDYADLPKVNDKTALETWKSNTKQEESDTLINILRIATQIIGIALLIWAILFYLSYWLDTLNTIVPFSLMSILTFGKLTAVGDESQASKGSVTHKRALIISVVTVAISVAILSGFLYTALTTLVFAIKDALS